MHYLFSLVVPPVLLLASMKLKRRRSSLLVLCILSTVLMYGVTVSSAFATSAWYSYQAESHDKNRDGVVSLEEQSPAQSEAMELSTNDAGRNMTVLFGAIWAAAVSTVFFVVVAAVRHVVSRRKEGRGSSRIATSRPSAP